MRFFAGEPIVPLSMRSFRNYDVQYLVGNRGWAKRWSWVRYLKLFQFGLYIWITLHKCDICISKINSLSWGITISSRTIFLMTFIPTPRKGLWVTLHARIMHLIYVNWGSYIEWCCETYNFVIYYYVQYPATRTICVDL